MHQQSSRAAERDTIPRQPSALAEFHDLAGHAGAADSCQDCAAQQQRQRQTAAALRAHQRQTRQQVDAIVEAGE